MCLVPQNANPVGEGPWQNYPSIKFQVHETTHNAEHHVSLCLLKTPPLSWVLNFAQVFSIIKITTLKKKDLQDNHIILND